MPLLNLQRRGRQIGEIRIGHQIPTGKTSKDGQPIMRPAKLDAFRFTTRSPNTAQAVAELLGGEVRETTLANGQQTWEIYSQVDQIDVMVPPGDAAISQWMEQWSKGGVARRCDGITEQLTQTPCMCPADVGERTELAAKGLACKPHTRVNVMLPDLPDLGVWLVQSTGFYAADWLGGTAEVLARAREQGVIVPATLRLEQRQVVRDGKTFKFAVPVLELRNTLRELTALDGNRQLTDALPPPPPPRAITAGESTPGRTAQQFKVPQDIADAATRATTLDEVLGLGKAMTAQGWQPAQIVTADGELSTLREYLLARHTTLQQDAVAEDNFTGPDPTPDEEGVVEAQVVDDEGDPWQGT